MLEEVKQVCVCWGGGGVGGGGGGEGNRTKSQWYSCERVYSETELLQQRKGFPYLSPGPSRSGLGENLTEPWVKSPKTKRHSQ